MSQIDDFLSGKPAGGQPGKQSEIDAFLGAEDPSIGARVKQGASRAIDSARTALTNDPKTIARIAAEQAATALPQTHLQRKMADEFAPYVDAANKAEGVVDNVKAWGAAGFKRAGQLLSNPGEAAKMVAEQLPNSLPALAGGFAGAKAGALLGTAVAPGIGTTVGGVLGGIAGGFAGGYGLEKGAAMQEQVQKEAQARGIDIQKQDDVSAMVGEKLPEFESAAQRKGVGTAGTDAVFNVATMGLAGLGGRTLAKEARSLAEAVKAGTISAADASTTLARLEAANAARNTLGANTLRGTGVVGAEMVGEGVSEAAGQKFAYGKVDAGDVIDESLLGLGSGGAMALGSKAFNKVAGVVDQDATTQMLADLRQGVDAMGQPTGPIQAQPPASGPTLALPAPDPGVIQVGADGTARTPPYQVPPYVGDVTDVEPKPVNPVREQVAAAAEQGGALSAAALTAIDAGVTESANPGYREIDFEDADPYDQATVLQFFKELDAERAAASYFDGNDDDIPDFGAPSNATTEQFLRAMGASEEEIQDAVATSRKRANAQSNPSSNVAAPAYEPADPRQSVGASASRSETQVAPRQPDNFTGTPTAAMGQPGATVSAGPGFGLKDALAQIRARKQQEASNAQAAQAAPAATEAPGAAPAAGPAPDIKAITGKLIPDMMDAELQVAIEHYGPAHQRTAKLQKEVQRRAAPAATTIPGVTNGPQAPQAEQASPQPAQAGAAPTAGPATGNASAADPTGTPEVRALTDGAQAQNTGAQAAPAAGPQGATASTQAPDLNEVGARWARMTSLEREGALKLAGWRTNAGGLNVVGKRLLRTSWGNMVAGTQDTLARAMSTRAEVGGNPANGGSNRTQMPDEKAQNAIKLEADQIAEAVSKADRLDLKGAERAQWVAESLSGIWAMTPDEVRDVPEVAAALRKKPSKEDATAASVRAVEQVMRQAEQAATINSEDAAPTTQSGGAEQGLTSPTRAQPGEPGYTLLDARNDLIELRTREASQGAVVDDRLLQRIREQEKLVAEMERQGSSTNAEKPLQDAPADQVPSEQAQPASAPSDSVVNVPPAIAAALDADMQAQKARVTRLRNEAAKDGTTLEEKTRAQTQLKGAEFTLQTMRRTRFDAEDAAIKAIEQKDMAPFAEHITFFKTEKALQELIGAAQAPAPAAAPKKVANKSPQDFTQATDSGLDYADGQQLGAQDLLAYFDKVIAGSQKGERIVNPRFQIGEVDDGTAQEIARFINGYDGNQRRLRVSGRTIKHIHESRPAIAREIVGQLPGMFSKPDEVLPDPKHLSRRALLVKERTAQESQSKQKSYVATVEVEIEVEVRDGFIDIVTIMTAPDRSLREARELKKNWPEGQQRTEQAVNSPHPLTAEAANPEADFPDAQPAAGSVPPAATPAQPDTPKLTPAQAKDLMEWQDMGQRDGIKTHALWFYESQADKDAKRGRMMVAKVSKEVDGGNWLVYGADEGVANERIAVLGMAKKKAEEVGMAKAVSDGYVEQAAANAEPAKATARSNATIEDAGQKIGGARKDRWKERGLNLDDLDDMTEAEGAELATKANVWKPDYDELSRASEPVTAAMVKVIYDRLAAKPKKNTPEGRRQYVQMMRIVRDVLTEANSPEAVRNAYQAIRQRAGLNTIEPQAKTAARELLFSVYKGRSDPFVLGGADLMNAKNLVAGGFPAKAAPWKTRLVVGREEGGPGTTERGVEIYMARSAEVGTPLTREQILDGFYRVVTKDNKAVAFAPSKADAEAAAATVYERDMKGKKDGKPEPVRPNLDELKRENMPRRIDRDVKADDFVNDLGFRGIEFGNWSAQDERQRILNMAYDGLMDLAEIMGVPPKAMSLNGTLGMAFGARGGGRFAAHYEPGKLVINMTKIRGGGSMAHEWAHAMDHYFGELDKPDAYTTQARGASGWYSEDQYLGVPRKRMEKVGGEWKNVEKMRLDNLRPEMAAAFDGVMRALFSKQITKAEMVRSQELDLERTEALARNEQQPDLKAMYQNMVQNKQQALNEMRGDPEGTMYAGRGRSEYASQAQKLSGKSTDGYWVRPTEMFARAFESWVFDRVTAMGAKSDYLVHGVEEDRFAGGAYKGNPYPAGDERARINAAFEKLASTIQTKETDDGVAMFSRTSSTKRAYESRIDALFAGEPASRVGAKVLDRSDVLGLLGYPDQPVILAEGKVRQGRENHQRMTAEIWKKIPEWLDSPAAAVKSDTVPGRLVLIAPELVNGAPVRMILEPNTAVGGMQVHLLVNAFDATGRTPWMRWASDGLIRYVDKKKFPEILAPSELQLSRVEQASRGTEKILTEKQLAGYRRANATAFAREVETGMTPEQAVAALYAQSPMLTAAQRRQSDERMATTQSLVDDLKKNWVKAPKIIFARNMNDPQVPQAVRDYDAKLKSQGSEGEARGFIHKGTVYLLSDQLQGPQQIAETLFHEVLGHYGLRGAFGDGLRAILQQMGTMRRRDVLAKAREYGMVDKSLDDAQAWAAMSEKVRLDAAEEVLAEMAQSTPEIGFVQRAIAAIRTWLRANVPGFKNLALTDAEIVRSYILPARGFVTRSSQTPQQSLQRSLMPAFGRGSNDGTSENDADLKAVEQAYGGQPAWEKARAEGKTKLTYGQWLQVRTPKFKAWFGDWEAVRAQERLDAMEPVEVRVPDEWRGLSEDKMRERMSEALGALVESETTFTHPDLGEVKVGRRGQKKTVSTSKDPADMLVAASVETLLPKAIYARSDATNEQGVMGYAKLLLPVDVDGIGLVAVLTVRRQADGNWYYNTVTVEAAPEKEMRPGSYASPGATSRPLGQTPITGLNAFVRQPLRRVNPATVSKAIDPQTGEPLVVYHGTSGERTVFEPYWKQLERDAMPHELKGSGSIAQMYQLAKEEPEIHFFAAERGTAESYGPDVVEAYLEIDYMVGDPNMDRDEAIQLMLDQDADGAIFRDTTSSGRYGGVAYVVRRSNQIKSATGNNGNFDPEDNRINFSRSKLADLKNGALDRINQAMSYPGKVSLWDKTVGTMRHLAERAPAFKPVFEAAQRFIDDVSTLANEAADAAPRLLPRIESLSDLKKKPISAEDNKAIARPLFEGTLLWGRDGDGKAVLVDDLEKKYANLPADDKAQMMLRTGRLDAGVLRMWRGLPLDQYESAINTRFQNSILKPGVVWTEQELQSLFNATPKQISLYQEARAAIDRSIDLTVRADMLRLLGAEYAPMRDAVMDAPLMTDALTLLVDTLEREAQDAPDQRDRLAGLMHQLRSRHDKAQELIAAGYAPLSRFGRHTVDVVDANGERQYFGMFESAREANLMAMKMRDQYKGATVKQGTMSQKKYKLLSGITPESLELFGNMLGLDAEGDNASDKAFQDYLKETKNNHSALKRLIHRKGIAGYSEDVGRVLASFVYSNARQAAGGLNAGTMETAISKIPQEQGELRDVATDLRDYLRDPQEEGQAIRGMLFAQYLGGSVASAFVNMTQPFAVTMPYLSQFGGMKKAAAQMARAVKDIGNKTFKGEPDLARALHQAVEDGTVAPQEIHQLMAQARGTGSLRVGDGTKVGDARAAAANNWERVKVAWGQPFALAEQFNRRATFIAAFRMAKEQGNPNPAEFARKAVLETQFLYSKANKAQWARGAVGGTLMTFKTYSVSYLELLQRTWNAGKPRSPERAAGRRAVAWAVVMLLLMGGAGGLPFAEDLEDLIDGAGQLMGYNMNSKQWRKELMREVLGQELGDFVNTGVSGLPGAPIDVSGRLGMGNMIPGTGLLLSKQNRERDLLEIAGPAGDLVSRGFTGARKLLTGDLGGAALEVSPSAVRNAAKGIDMAASGIYKDDKGYKVLDTTLPEAAAKFIGFQPRSVAKVQEASPFMLRSKAFYAQTSSEIKAEWAKALFEKDEAGVQRARERVADWNRDNPDQRMTVQMPDIWKLVREMGKDRTQRIADTAPKALRDQMRQEVQRVREPT